MPETITVSRVFQVTPERLYEAWLDPQEHGAMTKTSVTADTDGSFTASDGYISGKTIDRVPGRRIIQQWRTTQFPEGAPDSRVELTLSPGPSGTTLTLAQSNIPEGQGDDYAAGWQKFYFDPMESYFAPPSLEQKVEHALEEAGARAKEALEAIEEASESVTKDVMKAVKKVQARAKAGVKTVQKKMAALKRRTEAAPAKAKASKPTKAAKPAKTAKPAKSAKAAKSAKPSKAAKPPKTAKVVKPMKAVKSAKPSKATKPMKASKKMVAKKPAKLPKKSRR